jgi:DNA-binding GntR family transcriptional regulator
MSQSQRTIHATMSRNPAARPVPVPAEAAGESADEQRVHQAIVEAVLSHQLPPGTRLVETPLCEAFGVNRSLLRRVFVRLANEKVIELQHNRGASVAQPSQAEMHEVFDVRRVIEAGIVRRLCQCGKPADFARLTALVADERRAYETGDRARWLRLSGEYHLEAARSLGNGELESLMHMLVARTTLMKALYHAPGGNVCSFDEHAAIVEAMASGDADGAARLMDEHLQDAELKLRQEPEGAEVDLAALFGRRRRR